MRAAAAGHKTAQRRRRPPVRRRTALFCNACQLRSVSVHIVFLLCLMIQIRNAYGVGQHAAAEPDCVSLHVVTDHLHVNRLWL